MTPLLKALLAVALVIPLAAYVAGSLVSSGAGSPDPGRQSPVILRDAPADEDDNTRARKRGDDTRTGNGTGTRRATPRSTPSPTPDASTPTPVPTTPPTTTPRDDDGDDDGESSREWQSAAVAAGR